MKKRLNIIVLFAILFIAIAIIGWPLSYKFYLVNIRKGYIINQGDYTNTIRFDISLQYNAIMSYVTINAIRLSRDKGSVVKSFMLTGSEIEGVNINMQADYALCYLSGPIYYWDKASFVEISRRSYLVILFKDGSASKTMLVPHDYDIIKGDMLVDMRHINIGAEYVRWMVMNIPTSSFASIGEEECYGVFSNIGLTIDKHVYGISNKHVYCRKNKAMQGGNILYPYQRFKCNNIDIYRKEEIIIPLGARLVLYVEPAKHECIIDKVTDIIRRLVTH